MSFRNLRVRAARLIVALALITPVASIAGASPAHAAGPCTVSWWTAPVMLTFLSAPGANTYQVAASVFIGPNCAAVTVELVATPVGAGVGTTCIPLPGSSLAFPVSGSASCIPQLGLLGVAAWGTPVLMTWTINGAGTDGTPLLITGQCTVITPPGDINARC